MSHRAWVAELSIEEFQFPLQIPVPEIFTILNSGSLHHLPECEVIGGTVLADIKTGEMKPKAVDQAEYGTGIEMYRTVGSRSLKVGNQ